MPTARTLRAASRALGACACGLVLVAVLAGPAAAEAARTARPAASHQTSPSAPPSTTKSLLQGTTVPSTTAPVVNKTGAAASKAASDNRRVWAVVAGLVGVAVLLTALTIWFWYRTKPRRVAAADAAVAEPGTPAPPVAADPPPATPPDVAADAPPPDRRPQRSVAGLDHLASDNDYAPQATGEFERIESNVLPRSARPSRPAREEVIRASRPPDQG